MASVEIACLKYEHDLPYIVELEHRAESVLATVEEAVPIHVRLHWRTELFEEAVRWGW